MQHLYGGYYLDYALFFGLLTSIFLYLLSSKQGLFDTERISQGQTGFKIENPESELDKRTNHRYKPVALLTSILYTVGIIVTMVIVY
ncbi:hypothetical protein ACFWM3_23395 [Gottfriedia sp. NPDC058432]|uniref:hypothetical protein n=1 Tax=Gottfriedia sp. NPDC058432 TaxID=3346497 RepID=UPI00364CAB48